MSKDATTPRPRSTNQVVGTPWEFIHAVERRFGKLHCDLAALPENAKAPQFITPEQDSLAPSTVWPTPPNGEWNWLNPPFSKIVPSKSKPGEFSSIPWIEEWVAKVVASQVSTLVLVPAAVGSNWYAEYVENKTMLTLFLSPRIAFDGSASGYPKDLMLLVYEAGGHRYPPQQWRWK